MGAIGTLSYHLNYSIYIDWRRDAQFLWNCSASTGFCPGRALAPFMLKIAHSAKRAKAKRWARDLPNFSNQCKPAVAQVIGWLSNTTWPKKVSELYFIVCTKQELQIVARFARLTPSCNQPWNFIIIASLVLEICPRTKFKYKNKERVITKNLTLSQPCMYKTKAASKVVTDHKIS